ncbi:MAG: HEAT repeat domain-containing protein [Promethearchaeota archaeon]
MSYLRDNKIWEEDDDLNWDIIEISKVDDKIITYLLENLRLDKSDLSDNFFIAFESLLKIGKKAQNTLDFYIRETNEIHSSKLDIFNYLLDFIKNDMVEYLLVPHLYNPDFITRARTIFKIQQAGDIKYLKFILPLLNDPDDSVRWAVLQFLDTYNMVKNPLVYKELKYFIEKESNSVIKEKGKELFKKLR